MELYVVAYGNERYNETTDVHLPARTRGVLHEFGRELPRLYSNDDYRNYPFFKCAGKLLRRRVALTTPDPS